MRKTTLALTAMLMASPIAAQSFSASAMKAERDRTEAGDGVRFLDSVPTWGHAGRIKANEDLYRQQVQEAQDSRRYGQMMQMERDLSNARALESESQIYESDEYRAGKFRSGSGRYDFVRPGPPRVGPPPPPPRPPKSSAASQGRPALGREPPPPPPPPRPPR